MYELTKKQILKDSKQIAKILIKYPNDDRIKILTTMLEAFK